MMKLEDNNWINVLLFTIICLKHLHVVIYSYFFKKAAYKIVCDFEQVYTGLI